MTINLVYLKVELSPKFNITNSTYFNTSKEQEDESKITSKGVEPQLNVDLISVVHEIVFRFNTAMKIDEAKDIGEAITFYSITGLEGIQAIGTHEDQSDRRRMQEETGE